MNLSKNISKSLSILLTATAVLALALTIASCSKKKESIQSETAAFAAETPSPSAAADGWSSQWYDAQAMKGIALNMYCVTDTVRPILNEFQKDTGILIEHLTMKNGEILQRLINEKKSGVTIADLWFTGGADTFINAAQKGLLEQYNSPEGEVLDEKMKDPDGFWYGTSLTVINWIVNKKLIAEKGLKIPETWEDLLQPGLQGEVSMSNPASSGTAYNIISAVLEMKGEQEGWRYLERLIKQVPFFTPRGSDPASLVVNGEAIVGINPSNGDDDLERNNSQIKIVYPSDGTGWWPQPVAIVRGTKHEAAAKVFIDWILSKKGMKTVAGLRRAAVARKDIAPPEGIIDIGKVNLFQTNFQANARKRDAILKEWGKRVQ